MTLAMIRDALLWSFLINMGILLYWFAFFVWGRGCIYRMHTKWFKLSPERFDEIQYGVMGIFKIFIIVFNLVPYIALHIID
ncbi:DUF6868 family protein [Verrucomicrobiota bacterium]